MAINPADITTVRVGQLTPETPLLTSIIAHEIDEQLHRCTVQDLIAILNLNVGTLQYEVKTLYVDQEYIDTNFDSTGLGRLLCAGFAIINGNNGTPPAYGMFELSYKKDVYEIGSYGGSKDAVVVAHNHNYDLPYDGQTGGISQQSLTESAGSDEKMLTFQTSETGESGTDKNMPPYFVCLKIMKL